MDSRLLFDQIGGELDQTSAFDLKGRDHLGKGSE